MESNNGFDNKSAQLALAGLFTEMPLPEVCKHLYGVMTSSYGAALQSNNEGFFIPDDIYALRLVFEAFSKMNGLDYNKTD